MKHSARDDELLDLLHGDAQAWLWRITATEAWAELRCLAVRLRRGPGSVSHKVAKRPVPDGDGPPGHRSA